MNYLKESKEVPVKQVWEKTFFEFIIDFFKDELKCFDYDSLTFFGKIFFLGLEFIFPFFWFGDFCDNLIHWFIYRFCYKN